MTIYIIACDDSGSFITSQKRQAKRNHAHFITTAIILDADRYHEIRKDFNELKNRYSIEEKYELKFESLNYLRKFPEKFSQDHPELSHLTYSSACSFVEESLNVLSKHKAELISIVTENKPMYGMEEKRAIEMHLEDIVGRFRKQKKPNDLGFLFID